MSLGRWVAGALIVASFGYGFVAGSYRLPPFYQVAWVKNVVLAKVSTRTAEYVPPTAEATAVLETGLQRLLIKRFQLPNANDEYSGGGSLAQAGGLLYVVTSEGAVTVMDPAAPRRVPAAIALPPINRAELMKTKLRYTITTFWFRSAGAYAEVVDDTTHRLFLMHNRFDADRMCITFDVSRVTLRVARDSVNSVGDWKTIFASSPCMTMNTDKGPGRYPYSGHISGGKMIEWNDQQLMVSVGDYTYDGWQRPAWSQDRSVPYGKYILLDKETGRWEIAAMGARNAMGLYRDSAGTVWATESGPQGGDELNIVEPGANYGWPSQTFGINYENTRWEPATAQGRHDGDRAPVLAWLPSIVPTNLVRFDRSGGGFDLWRNDLLIGSLRDQALHHLRLDAQNRVMYDERIPIGDRIRDLVRLPDGTVALLTDATGRLLLIADGGPIYEPLGPTGRAQIERLENVGRVLSSGSAGSAAVAGTAVTGADLFRQRCSSCHGLNGQTVVGPPLDGLLDRYIGSRAGFNYSEALRTDGRRWSEPLLRKYLADPQGAYPGSRMARVALTAPEMDSLVVFLGRGTP
jgi:cytochrome c2